MNQSRSHISSKPRLSLPRLLGARKSFTLGEVRLRLASDAVEGVEEERTAAVHAMAARTSLWSTSVPDHVAFELGRTATRLPTVVFWYRQGVPLSEIGRRLSPFGGVWDGDRALDAAASLIANALNRGALEKLAA